MESFPLWVLGNPKTKSILTASHGRFGIGNVWYNPVFWLLPLACWHILHFSTNILTSIFFFGY